MKLIVVLFLATFLISGSFNAIAMGNVDNADEASEYRAEECMRDPECAAAFHRAMSDPKMRRMYGLDSEGPPLGGLFFFLFIGLFLWILFWPRGKKRPNKE
jgi:hypothetical protein